MNKFELALEILKISLSEKGLSNLSFSKRKDVILENFELIYKTLTTLEEEENELEQQVNFDYLKPLALDKVNSLESSKVPFFDKGRLSEIARRFIEVEPKSVSLELGKVYSIKDNNFRFQIYRSSEIKLDKENFLGQFPEESAVLDLLNESNVGKFFELEAFNGLVFKIEPDCGLNIEGCLGKIDGACRKKPRRCTP